MFASPWWNAFGAGQRKPARPCANARRPNWTHSAPQSTRISSICESATGHYSMTPRRSASATQRARAAESAR
eukprot:7819550-Alexandrium_andersonii.AAC.1